MRKNKLWQWLFWIVGGLCFFTSLRIICLYQYHLHKALGVETIAMHYMDKAHNFDLSSYITGGLHFSVVIVVLMIILDK